MRTSVALAIAVQAAFAARLLEDAVDYSVGTSDLTPYMDDGSGLLMNSSESVAVMSAAPADDAAGDLEVVDEVVEDVVKDAAEEGQDLTVEASDNQAVQSQSLNKDVSIDKIGEIATQDALKAQGQGDYYNVGLGGAHGGSLGG